MCLAVPSKSNKFFGATAMVSKATRRVYLLADSFDPIIQPLKNIVLFLGCAVLFWGAAQAFLGHHLPNPAEIVPVELVAKIRGWFR